jgi:hypothetical protein
MVLLESNCSTVIGKFQERCRDRSIISPVICDGLEAIKALSDVSFSRVSSVGDSHEGPLKNRGESSLKLAKNAKRETNLGPNTKYTHNTIHAAVTPAAHRSGPAKRPLERGPPRSRAHAALE